MFLSYFQPDGFIRRLPLPVQSGSGWQRWSRQDVSGQTIHPGLLHLGSGRHHRGRLHDQDGRCRRREDQGSSLTNSESELVKMYKID